MSLMTCPGRRDVSLILDYIDEQEPRALFSNKQQKFISHDSRGHKSDIRVPAWLRSGKGPLLGCGPPTSYCILMW